MPLVWATRIVLRFHRSVLCIALLLSVLAAVATARFLEMRTSRLDLLNPDSRFNQRWLAYLDEFGKEDDILIVVEGRDPETVIPVVEDVAARLIAHDDFESVLHKFDFDSLQAKGLHLLPLEELDRIDRYVAQVEPLVQGHWQLLGAREQVQQLNHRLSAEQAGAQQASFGSSSAALELTAWAEQLRGWMSGQQREIPLLPGVLSGQRAQLPESDYLLSPDGTLAFIVVRARQQSDAFVRNAGTFDDLRRLLDEAEEDHPTVQVGLTGLPVLESDEMSTSQRDMTIATLVSLAGVACLFIAGFGGLRYPLMTILALLAGMAWSFGYATAAVGHLNILSISFAAILIGLGVDFGIHYIASYLEHRKSLDCPQALQRTVAQVGPGVVTGAITTSMAFGAAALTDFTGIAELGIIAGGGILLCMLAALFVLPAMIYAWDRRPEVHCAPPPLPTGILCKPVCRYPRLALLLTSAFTLFLAAGVVRLRFDHNLLNMQPRGLESVIWERQLLDRSSQSVWFAISMADDPQDLLRRKKQFEQLPSVGRTEEIVSLIAIDKEKSERISRIQQRLNGLQHVQQMPVLAVPAREQLQSELATARHLASSHPQADQAVVRLQTLLESLPRDEYQQRLSSYQHRTAAALVMQLRSLLGLASEPPPDMNDVPQELSTRFVGRSGGHLLRVYARGDVWDMEGLEQFVRELESVDPLVTGHPVQTFYASRQMQRSYIHAGVYAFLAVAAALMLDFRHIRRSLLAMLPMGLGLLQLFGMLGWLGIPLNAANMIVLPLILGIGIDDGVHVLHDYLRQRGSYVLGHGTTTAIIMTSSTTMIGFGSMMFAQHQGLRSLGQVLTLGVFCCLVSSLVVLPALLSCMGGRRIEEESSAESAASQDVPQLIRPRRLQRMGAADRDYGR